MVKGIRKITWAPRAIKQFNLAIEYIRKDPLQNADSVKEKILAEIARLSDSKVTHCVDPIKATMMATFTILNCLAIG